MDFPKFRLLTPISAKTASLIASVPPNEYSLILMSALIVSVPFASYFTCFPWCTSTISATRGTQLRYTIRQVKRQKLHLKKIVAPPQRS